MQRPRITTRRLMLIVAALAIPCALIAWFIRGPETAGAMEAEQDIAAGILHLKTYGLPSPGFDNYAKLMQSRLGVEITGVAGCDVTDDLVRNVAGYNGRMEQEIARRFGPNAHNQVMADAEKGMP